MRGRRLTTEEAIKDFKEIHGDKYDYSLVNYVNKRTKVLIICEKHGEFEQTPDNHKQGKGCSKCCHSRKLSTIDAIEHFRSIHNSKYDYSLVDYINNSTPVSIICKTHGRFDQRPDVHKKGGGCPICANNIQLNTEDVITEFNLIHSNRYDYSLMVYTNTHSKVKIICPNHGEFEQTPASHKQGIGCPSCRRSKGEDKVAGILDSLGIPYISQASFSDCRDKRPLPFDFYIPSLNTLIEFDGRQHTEPVDKFGAETGFSNIIRRDTIKNKWASDKGYSLWRVSDETSNIEEQVKNILQVMMKVTCLH